MSDCKSSCMGQVDLVLLVILACAFAGLPVLATNSHDDKPDVLYLSDVGRNSINRYDAVTGRFLGDFGTCASSGALAGPQGIVNIDGQLYVNNQNIGKDFNGEVLRFDANGFFNGALVPCNLDAYPPRTCVSTAPFAPRGLIRGSGRAIYVADVDLREPGSPGRVIMYDQNTAAFLGNFDTSGFAAQFFPRGIVAGPDGHIYVSAVGDLTLGETLTGYVLRFDSNGRFIDVVANSSDTGCATHLHRPEGLVFGPDHLLYITSFRADPSDTDKILVWNTTTKRCSTFVNLNEPSEERAYAQALLFGPNNRLFVPITFGDSPGEVRRYCLPLTNGTSGYDTFVAPASDFGRADALTAPTFLTFGRTDPATLVYV